MSEYECDYCRDTGTTLGGKECPKCYDKSVKVK